MLPLATSTWDSAEQEALQRVIASNHFTMGSEVKEAESVFARYFGSEYCVMSNSGSSANLLAAASLRFSGYFSEQRDEIIVPAVSWSTTYFPFHQLGFKLVFVDVDSETWNIDLEKCSEAISPKTAGVVAVNLLGNPANLHGLKRLCEENDLFLVEDNCESMGAQISGSYTGTVGLLGTFSSYFSHHISTIEGGFTLTNDRDLYERMLSLRAHGWLRDLPSKNTVHNKSGNDWADSFSFALPGYNLRPMEFQGALAQSQLDKLDYIVDSRRKNAEIAMQLFHDNTSFRLQKEQGQSSWFGFGLLFQTNGLRDQSRLLLGNAGVETRPIVAGNFTRQPVVRHLRYAIAGSLLNADSLHERGLFFGNHHYPIVAELEKVKELFESNPQLK